MAICVQCRTGGARMQEGASSLMQMSKISVAVEALQRAGLPFLSVLNDPTYGGVSASYAMQADVKIAVDDARIGFAGPQVILNTMCEADQQLYDRSCPADFQSASYVWEHGQLDLIIGACSAAEGGSRGTQAKVVDTVASLVDLLSPKDCPSSASFRSSGALPLAAGGDPSKGEQEGEQEAEQEGEQEGDIDKRQPLNYTDSRRMDRPQVMNIHMHTYTHTLTHIHIYIHTHTNTRIHIYHNLFRMNIMLNPLIN